jgi:hypothetical protein
MQKPMCVIMVVILKQDIYINFPIKNITFTLVLPYAIIIGIFKKAIKM